MISLKIEECNSEFNTLKDKINQLTNEIKNLKNLLGANATESAENPNLKFDLEIFDAIV